MVWATVYGLSIGFSGSFEDKPFWKALKQKADWMPGKDAHYLTGALAVPPMPNDIV